MSVHHICLHGFSNIPYGTFGNEIIHFQKVSYTVMVTDLYAVG
jgi:hypothetical protein